MGKVKKQIVKYSPQVALGVGYLTGAAALVTTAIATKRSLDLINSTEDPAKLTKKDILKLCWKEYLLTAGLTVTSAASFGVSYGLMRGRTATLAAALGLSQTELVSLKNKLTEEVGKEKADKIAHEATKETLPQTENVKKKEQAEAMAGRELFRIFEPLTGQEFYGTMDQVSRALNKLADIYSKFDVVTMEDWLACLNEFVSSAVNRSANGAGFEWNAEQEEMRRWRRGTDWRKEETGFPPIKIEVYKFTDSTGRPVAGYSFSYNPAPKWVWD